MFSAKACAITALAGIFLSCPASAAEIHKWVDTDGITHYSDEPPPSVESPVTRIEVSERRGIRQKGDYYSIANQWARMHRERIERDRIRLEQERLKAAQRAQTDRTEVVYIEKPAVETRYVKAYPRKLRRAYGHYRSHYRHGRHKGYARHKQPRRLQTGRASLGYYKQLP